MSQQPKRDLRRKTSNRYRYGCASGKRGYKSEGEAYLEMLKVNERNEAKGDPRRLRNVYRCACGRWHMTQKESDG